jgi:serine/threonine protein kinase
MTADAKEFIINKEWKLVKRLGAGSFGEIFLAVNSNTNEEAAVKMEAVGKESSGQLEHEYRLLKSLDSGSAVGISKVFWFGKDGVQNLYTVLVMELLGPSLEDLFVYCGNKFSYKTTMMLADQMVRRVQHLHEHYLVHRDIKPDNFLMGTQRNFNTVYVIDFGLSKQYMDPRTKRHVPFRDLRNLTGTARYCSIKAHEGYEQSRRDDLEALGYVFVYFVRGQLPWQGLQGDSKRDKFKKIHHVKVSTTPKKLCEGLPKEFEHYLTYCRKLEFEQEPDYKYLRGLFYKCLKTLGETYDFKFDWILKS